MQQTTNISSTFSEYCTGYCGFGFNGKENDNEVKGVGNQQDYGFRIYDPRIGKFLSIDPLTNDFPWYTPYQFAGNQPIWAIDLDGLEEYIIFQHTYPRSRGGTVTTKVDFVKTPVRMQATGASLVGTYYQPKSESRFKNEVKEFIKVSKNEVKDFTNTRLYKNIKENGRPKGTILYDYQKFIPYGDDQGRTKEQISEKFNSSDNSFKDHIDAMVSILVHDPNATLNIVGLASPYETNIDGTENSLSVENNEKLANQRAAAFKLFIQEYAEKNYNGFKLGENKFKTSGKISNEAKGDKDKRSVDQAVDVNISY